MPQWCYNIDIIITILNLDNGFRKCMFLIPDMHSAGGGTASDFRHTNHTLSLTGCGEELGIDPYK